MICIWQITGQIKDFGKMAVMLKGDIAGFLFEASMLFFKQHDGFFPEYQLMIMFWLLNHNENPLMLSQCTI